ncbi:MAG: VWA domain-containing protein, partial [Acidobacteriota bacterium]
KEDFLLYEDGKRQEITHFSQDPSPLSVILLLDVNSRMLPLVEKFRNEALQILARLGPVDEIALMTFGARAELIENFTKNKELIRKGLDKVLYGDRVKDSFIKEAIYQAAVQMRRSSNPSNRRVIIVITNNFSNEPLTKLGVLHSKEETLKQLYENGAIVCGLVIGGLGDKLTKELVGRKYPDQILLSKIFSAGNVNIYAQETGGEVQSADQDDALPKLLTIIDNLRVRYSIGYTPVALPKKDEFLRIEVKLLPEVATREGEIAIKTRRGYYGSAVRGFVGQNRSAEPLLAQEHQQACQYIDLMPLFFDYLEKAKSLTAAEKVRLFREAFLTQYLDLFSADTLKLNQTDQIDQSLADLLIKYSVRIEPFANKLEQLHRSISNELPRRQQDFFDKVQYFNGEFDIYLMPSLGRFEVRADTIKGRNALLFGIDTIALTRANNHFWLFFHYELFRYLHSQMSRNRDQQDIKEPLYELLWREGLAIYYSRKLNPGSDLEELLLSERSERRGTASLPGLARKMRADLASVNADSFQDYIAENLPEAGIIDCHYIAFLLAERLADGYTITALQKLSGEDLNRVLEILLRKIERGEIK